MMIAVWYIVLATATVIINSDLFIIDICLSKSPKIIFWVWIKEKFFKKSFKWSYFLLEKKLAKKSLFNLRNTVHCVKWRKMLFMYEQLFCVYMYIYIDLIS